MKRFVVLPAIAIVAGCGSVGSAGPVQPSQLVAPSQRSEATAAGREFVFTCQNGTFYACRVYDRAGRLLRTKRSELVDPQGVAADSDGRFYVANEGAKNVLVYAAGGRRVVRVLDDGGNVPIDVAVFEKMVAASNLHNVTVFLRGATKPSRTLEDANVFQGSGVAFDPSGNCFWSFTDEQLNPQVDEFAGCKGKPIVVPIAEGSPTGLAFDGKGNLWYTSVSTRKRGVYRCKGIGRCRIVYDQFDDPVYINFSRDFQNLWVDDPGAPALYEVDVASGKVIQKVTAGLTSGNPPAGVAAAPGPL